jgi:hypothetical protein
MTAPNGHANDSDTSAASNRAAGSMAALPAAEFSYTRQFSQQEINDFCAALEIPFDAKVIDWRVTNTTRNGKLRGQVIPYADQRAYTDRLNRLFSPAGWTRKYGVHTSANFERSKDQKTVAKVFVTCELSIAGFGTHSATGEGWTDDENAVTSAEAQAFKRASACFGLGRYLYYFEGVWVDLDERKRPKTALRLPQWATPEGWQNGLRPNSDSGTPTRVTAPAVDATNPTHARGSESADPANNSVLVRQIEALAEPLGKHLYRGLLKRVARAWSPAQIQDPALLERVLSHMQAAERGLRRLGAALDITGPEVFGSILQSLKVTSLDKVDNLETLKQIVLDMERVASRRSR